MQLVRLGGAVLVVTVVGAGCANGEGDGAVNPGSASGGAGGDGAGGSRDPLDPGGSSGGSEATGGSASGGAAPSGGSSGGGVTASCAEDEACDNGLDDDCDGEVDEGCGCAAGDQRWCYAGPLETYSVGECGTGTMGCTGIGEFGTWGSCEGWTGPSKEVCDDEGRDENCNGASNEGCECAPGSPPVTCGSNVGACAAGTQECAPGGVLGPCVGATLPQPELCNGIDDDCDGSIDEALARLCGNDEGSCAPGIQVCDAGTWSECVGAIGPIDGGCPDPLTVTCPSDANTPVGEPVTLVGGASDPGGGSVTYAWSVTVQPVGSSANPAAPTAATTTFTPDAPGSYTLQLCATNDTAVTRCCATTVSATSSCEAPAPPTITSCGESYDRRPVLSVTPVPAGVDYSVYRTGTAAPLGTLTGTGHNWFRPASAVSVGGPPAAPEAAELYVKACREDDATCCSVSDAVTVNLVEACDTAIAPTSDIILISEYLIDGAGAGGSSNAEAGESVEITNLSHCPVSLNGYHFSYRNSSASSGSYRWYNFTAADIVPPRGTLVLVRDQPNTACTFPFFGPESDELFGRRVEPLQFSGEALTSGWFNNTGGGQSILQIALGAYASNKFNVNVVDIITPYMTTPQCQTRGFDAFGACGDVSPAVTPTAQLEPNQLGRLWHPCDFIEAPVPDTCDRAD